MSNYLNFEEIKKIEKSLFSQMPSLFIKEVDWEITLFNNLDLFKKINIESSNDTKELFNKLINKKINSFVLKLKNNTEVLSVSIYYLDNEYSISVGNEYASHYFRSYNNFQHLLFDLPIFFKNILKSRTSFNLNKYKAEENIKNF